MDAQTAALIISLIVGAVSPFLLKYYPKLKDEAETIFTLVLSVVFALVIVFLTHHMTFDMAHLAEAFLAVYASQQAIYNLLKNPVKLNAHAPANAVVSVPRTTRRR